MIANFNDDRASVPLKSTLRYFQRFGDNADVKKHAPQAEVQKLRQALQSFMDSRGLVRSTWAKASGVSETSLRWFLTGKTQSLNDATYRKLAQKEGVSIAMLRGEEPEPVMVPIRSYVGAGAEIVPFDGDGPVDYVRAPPGIEPTSAGAYLVRGDSMSPMFQDGDVLFPELPVEPDRRIGSVVILELSDGRRLVKKLIRGAKRGRWTLLSVNPAEPPYEDQVVVRVAAIPWVKRKL